MKTWFAQQLGVNTPSFKILKILYLKKTSTRPDP
jgi:hypothetical protein